MYGVSVWSTFVHNVGRGSERGQGGWGAIGAFATAAALVPERRGWGQTKRARAPVCIAMQCLFVLVGQP